jgi:hypothetical protein
MSTQTACLAVARCRTPGPGLATLGTWIAALATMPTIEPAAPAAEEAERRAERAKASLLSRVDLLKHKLSDAKDKVDLPAHIVKNPLPAVGIAFALGVAVALRRSGSAPGGQALRGAVWSAMVALGLRAMRELALGQLSVIARRWIEHGGEAAMRDPGGSFPAVGDPYAER